MVLEGRAFEGDYITRWETSRMGGIPSLVHEAPGSFCPLSATGEDSKKLAGSTLEDSSHQYLMLAS